MNENLNQKTNLLKYFLVVGFIVSFILGLENILIRHNVLSGGIEVFLSIVLLVKYIIFRLKNNVVSASYISLFVLFVALIFLFTLGGIGDRTSIMWFYAFPIVSVFLVGDIAGFVLTSILIALTFLIYFIGATPFTFIETRQLGLSVLTVYILIRFYWNSNYYTTAKLKATSEELQKYLNNIKSDAEVEKQKSIMLEKTKLAMINLLEDGQVLEQQLKNEKEGVEKKVIEKTKELSNEKSKLLASIESLSRAFILIDTKGEIMLVNEKVRKYFNIEEENITLKVLQNKIGEIFDITSNYKDVLKTQKSTDLDNIVYGQKYLNIHSSVVRSTEAKDEIIGVLVTIGDVTEEKIIDRSKDEFFSIASHELRTPLTAIRGNSDMILQYYQKDIKDPNLKEMVNDMHESAVRLIDIVNDFLDMSRLEMHKMVFKNEEFEPETAVKDVIKEYQVTGSRSGLYLELDKTKGKIPNVFADRNKFKQVLINLIGNGMKFTKEGGVKVKISIDDKFVKFSVVDTGMGIPLESQSLLFRKFQQAESNILTRDGTKGTGLGLYISKLIVEGMGGTIGLERSEVNKGSIFTFTLPIAKLKA